MEKYDFKSIEKKWQQIWEKENLYQAEDNSSKEKFYCLDMFPYPSGDGLHVGHWRGYVLSDVISRYQKLQGKNVLHPMGWDAFGLPAENAAIKNKSHPKIYTEKAIERFRQQLKQIGAVFDWSREINTSEPEYYKWTQWLFLQLYKNGLAYRKKAPVNWCPSCQTVLANEQVIAGECERCDSAVEKKDLTQWFFKITNFAEDLLKDLDNLDWPERTKTLQRNWIGKSVGTEIEFRIKNLELSINVFTTRADTLFGCTYLVLSPEHPAIKNYEGQITNYEEVKSYIENAKKKSDIERTEIIKDKTGVKLEGIKAINPINSEEIDVWVADYVLASYGTGAVMAVPAHDERDYEFAKKYKINIKNVVIPATCLAAGLGWAEPRREPRREAGIQKKTVLDHRDKPDDDEGVYIKYGVLINSNDFNGLESKEAQKKITEKLKLTHDGDFSINHKLRDWLISRQRYWGVPIPMIYCDKCGEVPVPENDLPIKLPEDVEFSPRGESPLKKSKKFLETICPECGGPVKRETDTMDTFVCSSWYYLRYTDPNNDKRFASNDKLNYWLPVDFYVGGVEHAILHLLYARFISKALTKLKIVNFNANGEPFKKLFNIGMINLHGAKMSKSKGNIVSPDKLIEKYGTDALRGYELFIGPADQDSDWQIQGISGIYRFIEKIWQFFNQKFFNNQIKEPIIEKTVMMVTHEIKEVKPNTAISHLMEMFNTLKDKDISKESAKKINLLIAPFFPHLSEEIWQKMGNKDSIFNQKWPTFDQASVVESKIKIAIQINGKTRALINIDSNLNQADIEEMAKKEENIKNQLEGKNIKKVIYVSGKILNFVIE